MSRAGRRRRRPQHSNASDERACRAGGGRREVHEREGGMLNPGRWVSGALFGMAIVITATSVSHDASAAPAARRARPERADKPHVESFDLLAVDTLNARIALAARAGESWTRDPIRVALEVTGESPLSARMALLARTPLGELLEPSLSVKWGDRGRGPSRRDGAVCRPGRRFAVPRRDAVAPLPPLPRRQRASRVCLWPSCGMDHSDHAAYEWACRRSSTRATCACSGWRTACGDLRVCSTWGEGRGVRCPEAGASSPRCWPEDVVLWTSTKCASARGDCNRDEIPASRRNV